uniref:Neprosin PEP catalytic domain-containing protein n=1 Tax=Oryza rufipogon TaxID=4529 RepID=A0A0E0R5T3_ORYRU
MKKAISWISGALFIWMFLIEVAEPTKRAIKSIKADDGDVIDCINIYQQPAFNNPRLKNHTISTIKTRPGKLPFSKRAKTARQAWQNNGRCPDGTIAIRRATQQSQLEVDATQPNGCYIEYAGIQAPQTVYGARGDVNVWGIRVEPNEWSTNGIVITNGHGASLQFGWMVAPTLYGESHGKTRLFIRTVDPQNGVDCFNLNCAGFVQISNEYAFGAALAPLSEYGDVQYETHLTIYKDMLSNRWCAMYGDTMLGYWPLEAFPAFDKGEEAFWGGQVCNMHEGQEYTTTGMGSGYHPIEGMGKSAYIHGIQVMQIDKSWQRPTRTFGNMSNQPCYGVEPYESKDGALSIFFGGTANMACCGLACQSPGK